jgi:predicted transcriptional regulator
MGGDLGRVRVSNVSKDCEHTTRPRYNAQRKYMSIIEYLSKMKALSDEMAMAGRTLDDEELIECIIAGLDEEYTPFVSVISARTGTISLSKHC